ncbi:restriction endonuclease subunit S [Coprococcus comes]|uniref:restriction endonuclease subunit S n=1 Tax=Coprococcus comes TaxID=410072 RepID=UPI003219F3DE
MPYEKIGKNERVCIADDVPFEIPESWEWARWGTLSESIQYGYNAPAQENGRIKMVRISDIQDNSVMWETVPYCDIKEGEIDAYLLKPNDILFARTGGTVGKSYLVQEVPEEAIYAGYLIRTRYSNQLCPQYLKYFMESELYWSQLREGTIATAQPNCNGKTLGNMLVPIPPSHEQIRIVEKLNAVMTHVIEYDTVDSKSKHLNNIFSERLKKSILQEAVQGKLVPQDPADEPASILLERIRAEKQKLVAEGKIKKDKHESVIFRRDNSHYEKLDGVERCIDDEIPFEIPESWAWTRIGSITELITSGSRDWAKYYAETGALFLRMGNLSKNSFTLRLNNLQRVQLPQKAEGTRTALQAGDLLFSITGEVGMLGLIPDKFETAYVNQHIAVLRFFPDIRNKYLPYLLLTDYAQKFYKGNQHGIKNSFRLDSIYNVLVPIPPSQEQKRIIDKIEKLFHKITVI